MFWVQDNVPNKLKVRGCRIIFWSNMKQTPGQSWENKDVCTCVYMYRNHSKPCLCTSPLLRFLGGKVLMQQIYAFICIMVRWFNSLVVRGSGGSWICKGRDEFLSMWAQSTALFISMFSQAMGQSPWWTKG